MKKLMIILGFILATAAVAQPQPVAAYNFGDFRSETLATKAWGALAEEDIEAVLAYTNKCIELYAEQAAKMQASLKGYAEGPDQEIFSYWALNDVATSLFIQGEAYRKVGMKDEALVAYQKIIDNYSYGQTWDPKGWFWKPTEAAKEKIAMIKSGSNLDFGDYTSSFMTVQAWKSLDVSDYESVKAYTNKVIEMYDDQAKKMQASLTEYAWETKEKIFSYWALNDVGTSLFIQGEALKRQGKNAEAKQIFERLVNDYYYAQCWDPKGWFWKPAEGAQQALDELSES
ncbi:MAG TPA: tetratricopeptide repeat protein [Candidatus Omnitrophota bacterium]|nr:tetratricopeptide repeat protein [Candidatus Omnitrophota bacterium]